jgi:hypothetical protein
MNNFGYLLAAISAVALTAGADAAPRKKSADHGDRYVHRQGSPYQQISPSRPVWAAPQQCFTDDGYGRFTPCEGGGKGY